MKRLMYAIVAVSLAATAQQVGAQATGYDGFSFVDAVKNRDGNKLMELFHKNGAGIVNAKDGSGNTGLIVAITARNEDFTAFLLSNGADPNLQGKNGDTPLIAAARVGYDEAGEWLLSSGAKIDGTNRQGETPLIVAVQLRQLPMVRMLLSAGANPDKTDNVAGLSARDYAARDTRSRDIQQAIEAKRPKAATTKH